MAEFLGNFGCCGLRELDDIGRHATPNNALHEALSEMYYYENVTPDDINFSHAVFSQALPAKSKTRLGYGDRLAQYIETHDLGTVVRGATSINPNSGNKLTVFVWTLNRPALVRWFNQK